MGLQNSQAAQKGGLPDLPEHKQKAMIESYANFYGVDDDPKVNKLSYNKLYQASREKGGIQDPLKNVSSQVKNDPDFAHAQKKFFQGDVSDTASQYQKATQKFFDSGVEGRVDPGQTLGNKFTNVQDRIEPANMNGERYKNDTARFFGEAAETKSQGSAFEANKAAFYTGERQAVGFKVKPTAGVTAGVAVNQKSGLYKKDAAAFYGDDKFEIESQGTQFQRNAAAFMDTDMPASGERPFKIDKNAKGTNNHSQIKGTSYLNEQRLREHVSLLDYSGSPIC